MKRITNLDLHQVNTVFASLEADLQKISTRLGAVQRGSTAASTGAQTQSGLSISPTGQQVVLELDDADTLQAWDGRTQQPKLLAADAVTAGAPNDAVYLVAKSHPELKRERVLAVNAGELTMVDSGPGATFKLGLPTVLASPGTFTKVTVDSKGRVTLGDQITAAEILALLLTVDGSGSLLDSDLLDGQEGAFYRNAGNLNTGTLLAARFNDTSHGSRAGGALHANATTTVAGFMAATDKTKLDGITPGANNYVHPNHSGDVASVGDGATTIQSNVVTNEKLADMAVSTIKGRSTAGTGDPEDLTPAQVRTILNVEDGANNYIHPTTHPPSIIAQDASNRFVSDAEKTAWNNKLPLTGGTVTGSITISHISPFLHLNDSDQGVDLKNFTLANTGGEFRIQTRNDALGWIADQLKIDRSGLVTLAGYLTCGATTLCTNLNADLLDGIHAASFSQLAATEVFTGVKTFTPSSGNVAFILGAAIEVVRAINDTQAFRVYGGSAFNNGASLNLFGRDHATTPGRAHVIFGGYDSTGDVVFVHRGTSASTNKGKLDPAGNFCIGAAPTMTGANNLFILAGTAPTASASYGILYTANNGGVNVIHAMCGNGDVLKLFKGAAITATDTTAVPAGYDQATFNTIIGNLRTIVNDLRSRLQASGQIA